MMAFSNLAFFSERRPAWGGFDPVGFLICDRGQALLVITYFSMRYLEKESPGLVNTELFVQLAKLGMGRMSQEVHQVRRPFGWGIWMW